MKIISLAFGNNRKPPKQQLHVYVCLCVSEWVLLSFVLFVLCCTSVVEKFSSVFFCDFSICFCVFFPPWKTILFSALHTKQTKKQQQMLFSFCFYVLFLLAPKRISFKHQQLQSKKQSNDKNNNGEKNAIWFEIHAASRNALIEIHLFFTEMRNPLWVCNFCA